MRRSRRASGRSHRDSTATRSWCRFSEAKGGYRILLAGHLDTVPGEHDGPVRQEGDRLYGPGAADMKSGLALMLALADNPPVLERAGLALTFYSGEEGPYEANELEGVLECDPYAGSTHYAVCLEPSDNELQLGCAGSLHLMVRFLGRSGHSARPWEADNAIHKSGPLLSALANSAAEWVEVDGLPFATVSSVTVARGGAARNVVPGLFEVNVNIRFAPGQSPDAAMDWVTRLAGPEAEVKVMDRAPSALPFRSHPLSLAWAPSGARAVRPKQAWTDVGRFAARGIAAANFGPGVASQAHQRNEWTSVSQLQQGMGILRRWLRAADRLEPPG